MKLKEFGPRGGGGARPKFYYVDPPLVLKHTQIPIQLTQNNITQSIGKSRDMLPQKRQNLLNFLQGIFLGK